MVRPLRRLPFPFLLLPLALALLLAACEQGAAPGGPDAETVSVTLAPSLSPHGLATQGISGDLVIYDVDVVARDQRGLAGVGCFAFDGDGSGATAQDTVYDEACELSIWDGTALAPTTLQLPVRDETGDDIPYEFLLNVRSLEFGIGPGRLWPAVTAFASESVPVLEDGTTITFANLTSFLKDALLLPVDPLATGSACPEGAIGETFDVEPGDVVPLFLAPIAPGNGAPNCLPTRISGNPLSPFPDFGIGAASVLLDGDDITDDALQVNASKRGMVVQVPDDALSGTTLEVSLTTSGTGVGAGGGGTGTDRFVTATAPVVETATVSLQVVEPPVGAGLDVDLTAPVIDSSSFDNGATARLMVGPSDDPADVDSVLGFVGPRPLLLQFDRKFDTDAFSSTVTWDAFICNDFSAIAPASGDVTTLDATFYAIDPDGNQSAPYTAPITLNSLYPGPRAACDATVAW